MTGSRLLDRLVRSEHSGMKLGLGSFRRVLDDIGHPQRAYATILVGGTNGKGSVAAMLERMLRDSGYRTGLFTSPHLLSYRERVRVDGRSITGAEVARVMDGLHEPLERHGGSFFEAMTALAFAHFEQQAIDCAVLEVGLGGRLDSTNVCAPLVSSVVSIALDHTRILGRTLEAIAGEKVHIARRGRPFVIGAPGAPGDLLEERALRMGARPLRLGRDASWRTLEADRDGGAIAFRCGEQVFERVRVGLRGKHQLRNAAVALLIAQAVRAAGFDLQRPDRALADVSWPGRLQWIDGEPPVLLDGAHNGAGGRALADYLAGFCQDRVVTGVVGLLDRKKPRGFLRALRPRVDRWVVTEPPGGRALPAAKLALELDSVLAVAPDVGDALEHAVSATPADGLVVVCGSLRVIARALRELGRRRLDVI